MTIALCTNCGELKHGAWCDCSSCNEGPFDGEIAILLSDHNLSEDEMRSIGLAVRRIRASGVDAETRFHALLYFLSRKWPKLLEYSIDAVEPKLQKTLDRLYRSKLGDLPGQQQTSLKVSPIALQSWTNAMGTDYQEEDNVWQAEVHGNLMHGMEVAKQIVALTIDAGEGAVLQKVTHFFRRTFYGCDYRPLAARAVQLVGDAKEYRRMIESFCSRVKNGWSDRTKEQSAYFRGVCQRLEEMADQAKVIIQH